MPAPENRLKRALREGRMQRGVWLSLASGISAEIASRAGFDWCLIDAEHGPSDMSQILWQLQAMNGAPAEAVVRVPVNEAWIIKRVLDLGARSLLVPMVHDADAAAAAVAASHYPPAGIRGVGADLGRASAFGGHADYAATADAGICVMVQAESPQAVENIDAIAATEGVDVVFVGPADLAATMGHPGDSAAPPVREAIHHAIARTREAGKAAGIVTFDPDEAAHWAEAGVTFLGVGADVNVLASGLRALAAASDRPLCAPPPQ